MTNPARIRALAIVTILANVVVTGLAIAIALDPREDAVWQTWGYLQKGVTLLGIMTFWPMLKLSISTFLDTTLDEPEGTPVSNLIQAELDRVTRNPRLPEVH